MHYPQGHPNFRTFHQALSGQECIDTGLRGTLCLVIFPKATCPSHIREICSGLKCKIARSQAPPEYRGSISKFGSIHNTNFVIRNMKLQPVSKIANGATAWSKATGKSFPVKDNPQSGKNSIFHSHAGSSIDHTMSGGNAEPTTKSENNHPFRGNQ